MKELVQKEESGELWLVVGKANPDGTMSYSESNLSHVDYGLLQANIKKAATANNITVDEVRRRLNAGENVVLEA